MCMGVKAEMQANVDKSAVILVGYTNELFVS